MSAQDTNHRQEGITVKVIDQMSQSENETESFAIEEFKALVEIQQNEIKSLKQTKSILLIIIGLLMVGFAIFYPKLIKKLK
tara:strand:+ start:117 stop:359 length:243 start_codon:yes stop_codon:yes gene_type:complete